MATSGLANVVLNELELHSPGEDPQWVELFEIVDNGEDITGWSICPLNDLTKETFIDNCTSIGPAISRTIELQGGRIWM